VRDMISQLLLSKRLFLEGSKYVIAADPVSCGIAVSLFQDAIELLVWALVKKRDVNVKDTSTFTSNLEALKTDGCKIPNVPQVLELNKSRVGFKHYGNLPASVDAVKFQTTCTVFLQTVFTLYFDVNFDDLSALDVVPFPEVREHLRNAENFASKVQYRDAVGEASIANRLLFSMFDTYLPEVDSNLASTDRLIEKALNIPATVKGSIRSDYVHSFQYVSDYLEKLREVTLVSLLKLPFDDYRFLKSTLFHSRQMADQTWYHVAPAYSIEYDSDVCARQVSCLVEISVRLYELARQDSTAE
jgi:hypothetical protein